VTVRGQGRAHPPIPSTPRRQITDPCNKAAFNRNWVGALYALGQCKLFAGSIGEVIPLEQQAIRLSPRDPAIYLFYEEIGLVHLLESRIDEAIVWLEKARHANPEHPAPHIRLASAYALLIRATKCLPGLFDHEHAVPEVRELSCPVAAFDDYPKPIPRITPTDHAAG
jgi:tetratricopeptide (TPR) repeat protein